MSPPGNWFPNYRGIKLVVSAAFSPDGQLLASGGTPMLPTLFWAVDQLVQQPEPRKLLLVVTDGQPAQVEACKEAIRRCWLGEIEAIGIGIFWYRQ